MKNPSVSLTDGMDENIEQRREKGSNRSEYIREALLARFHLEDTGEWEELASEMDNTAAEPAAN